MVSDESHFATARPERPLVTIVVPAYDEVATFPILLDALLPKRLVGADKEIIIVESNSRDGTREIALRYSDHPEVKLILQECARGKGNAVREGLSHACGDIVMIQDADLEYDLDDYDELLAPILDGSAMFVLGSRHGGNFKMRQFTNEPLTATFMNFGHAVFKTALNVMYGARMKDPFTMYKVFRRECLRGIKLECNGFDFDFELVIKLLRAGYRPLEVPVNYHSRSFREGKKIRIWRDPLTWIHALIRYRFVSPFEKDGT
jgi:glycosyltransferase involved in cell wall biosynthesis